MRPSETPNSWDIGKITAAGALFGLAFCTAIPAVGRYQMHLDIDHLRTFCVISVVCGSQAITYAVRDRQHLWGLRPTNWLVMSSIVEMVFISVPANRGIEMSSPTVPVLAAEFLAATIFYFLLNFGKIPVFRGLHIT